MNPTKHIYWLDAIRVSACFLVCLIHAPLPGGTSGMWLSLYNYLAAPCIGLFFMVSGALLFPVRLPLGDFLRRRAKRILIPLLFWSLFAISLHYMLGQYSGEEAQKLLFRIPFAPVEGVYWFMYTIAGLYLFAPLISPALEKREHARYLLLLWGVTLCLPYLNAWLPGVWPVRGDFYHALSSFGGYLGYMALGYCLRRTPLSWKRLFQYIYLPTAVLAVGIPAWFLHGRYPAVTNDMLYGYLTINVAALCVSYFTFIQKASTTSRALLFIRGGGGISCVWWRNMLLELSQKSFGIYLAHIFVMRQFLWPLWQRYVPIPSYAIQIPAIALLTFVLSYLLIKALSLIPFSKYIL